MTLRNVALAASASPVGKVAFGIDRNRLAASLRELADTIDHETILLTSVTDHTDALPDEWTRRTVTIVFAEKVTP